MRPDLDPSLMTPDERRREVAAILAVGLRRLRDRDADGNGSLEERLWVQQDANFNVTALLDNNGNVVERYAYDPFGNFTVYDATWTVRTGGSAYAWAVLHPGLHYDATVTLYYNRFRWYDADLGRFMSNDPKGYPAGDVNLYRVEGGNPVSWLDPSGSEVFALDEKIAASLIESIRNEYGLKAEKIKLPSGIWLIDIRDNTDEQVEGAFRRRVTRGSDASSRKAKLIGP